MVFDQFKQHLPDIDRLTVIGRGCRLIDMLEYPEPGATKLLAYAL